MSTIYDFHPTSSTNIHSNFNIQRFFVQQCDAVSEKISAYNLAGEFANWG